MDKKLKIAIPVIAGTLAIGSGVGAAFARNADQAAVERPAVAYETASTTGTQEETTYPYYCGGYGGMMGYGAGFGVTPQVADLLGTTPADLRDRLAAGTTLADIAAEQGVSLDQLVEAVIAPFNDRIDLMLKYGYITEDDAVTLREQAREQARNMVTSRYGDQSGWRDFMDEMMDDYGHGGMMWGWGAPDADETPDTGFTPGPGPGYGGMMGGGYGGGYGGMMGGGFGGGFGGMMR
jgi:hypothetical protein